MSLNSCYFSVVVLCINYLHVHSYEYDGPEYTEALVIVYTAQFTGVLMLLALNFFADKMPHNPRVAALERPCPKISASWVSR